jgi:hypothetical protein
MIISLLLATLPARWSDLGRTVPYPLIDGGVPVAERLRRGLEVPHCCVSEDGRLIFNRYGVGVDSKTGKKLSIRLYGARPSSGVQFAKLTWGNAPPPSGWIEQGIVDVFLVRGNEVALDSDGSNMGGLTGFRFVGKIGGPQIAPSDGESTFRSSGIDVGLRPKPGFLTVTKGFKTVEMKLPGGFDFAQLLVNGVDWKSGHVYAFAHGQKNGLVVFGLAGSKIVSSSYPLPPTLNLTEYPFPKQTTVLADGSVCGIVFAPKPTGEGPPVSWRCATVILDKDRRGWKLYPGLVFYGASHNGRYVAYGWDTQGTSHIARVGT